MDSAEEPETLLLFLPPGMKTAIRLHAAEMDQNMNEVVREAIRKYVPGADNFYMKGEGE